MEPLSGRFCIQCGKPVTLQVPQGDNRPRSVCTECGHIHYENPKVIVGCLLVWQKKVLLCRRAIEPRHGFWTLPAGFMENNESTLEGAAREAYEEAMAKSDDLSLFSVYNVPRISQVHLMFFGQLKDGLAKAGEESLEVCLFDQNNIPWEEIAFPVVTEALKQYFEMLESNNKPVFYADVVSRPGAPHSVIRSV